MPKLYANFVYLSLSLPSLILDFLFLCLRWHVKMLSRTARNLVRNELLGGRMNRLSVSKTTVRTILTSKDTFQQQPLASSKEDISIPSPMPSIDYPNISIDQFVWADLNKWSNKTAVVGTVLGTFEPFFINFTSTGRWRIRSFIDLRSTARSKSSACGAITKYFQP